MPETKPNQAAFPLTDGNTFCNEGLTKREYFAAMAMQSIVGKITDHALAGNTLKYDSEEIWERASHDAVTIADKLIEELNK